jgi:hypothetical protein
MAATSIHIRPVKGGSEAHNFRTKKLGYVREDLTPNNEHWSIGTISNRRADIEQRYFASVGQKMQAKATPIREGVVVIQEDTTMQQLQEFCTKCQEEFGIKAIQIHIHRDEGHYFNPAHMDGWKSNLHAHIIFDFTNEAGKNCRLNRQSMVRMQDILADTLGMERGVSSDVKHLTAQQYKQVKASTADLVHDFQTLSEFEQTFLLQELGKLKGIPLEYPCRSEFRVGENKLTVHDDHSATIHMRGKDFDASAILSEFKRLNVDWRSISPSKIESLLRGQEIALTRGEMKLSLRLQKGLTGYVLKSALSTLHTDYVNEAEVL